MHTSTQTADLNLPTPRSHDRHDTRQRIQSFLSDSSIIHYITERTMANNPRKSGSFQAQINDLEVGESCSKVRAVDPSLPVAELHEALPALRQQLRNVIAPAVKRATEQQPSHTYATEVSEVLMPGGTLYIVAIVTRRT